MIFGNSSKLNQEQYELVHQNITEDLESGPHTPRIGDLTFEASSSATFDEEDMNDDNKSDTSEIFKDIDDFSKRNDANTEDNFKNDSKFQAILQSYQGYKSISKNKIYSFAGFLILLWTLAVILYSKKSATELVKSFKWQTDIIAYNGQNVTLNHYDTHNNNVTMQNYRKNMFYPFRTEIHWLNKKQYPKGNSGGYYLTRGTQGSFVVKQIHSEYQGAIIDGTQFEYENNFFYATDLKLNPANPVDQLNDNFHIVMSDKLGQWRHLSFAIYWLFDPLTKNYTPIQPPENEVQNDENQLGGSKILEKLHFAEFSPNGDHVIFGFDHNLYIQPLLGENTNIVKITNTGSEDIYNGKPDWVYEEEVIPDYKLFWWSPNQENLVFASINDTKVQDYGLDYYVKDASEVSSSYSESLSEKVSGVNQYPIRTNIKYPKPGSPNPIVSLYNYQLSTGKSNFMKQNDQQLGEDFILYDATWIDDANFLTKLSDRTSTILTKSLYQPQKSLTDMVPINSLNSFTEFNGWIEKNPPLTIIPSSTDEPKENGYVDKVVIDNRIHLGYFENARASNYTRLLTKSDSWDVITSSPVVFHEIERKLYFLTTMRSTMDAHLVAVNVDNDSSQKPQVITGIDKDGKYLVEFTEDGQYVNLFYDGPLQPWQKLLNIGEMQDFVDLKGEELDESGADKFIDTLRPINNIEYTKSVLASSNIPTRLYKTIKIGKYSDGSPIELNMIEILPPNFDPNSGRKYPLFVNVYGGPGSTTVDKSFSIDFQDVVSATLDAIVLIIDPRGTGDQNWKFRSFATNQIGYWEPRDLVSVVSEYISVNKFVNKYKTSLWGWSYGGFTTLKTLEYDAGKTFKFGMAVAPVTNWLFYDSIYTERYMNLPSKNENYEKISKINDFESFKSLNRFLIMHGTGDDNVHIQNSLWLIDNFDINEVENYDLHFFPDSDHSIYYHNANKIVFDKLLRWISDAFSGKFDDF